MTARNAAPPDGSTRAEDRMAVEDVGRAISYMASLSLESNVLFMTVKATEDAVRRPRLTNHPESGAAHLAAAPPGIADHFLYFIGDLSAP